MFLSERKRLSYYGYSGMAIEILCYSDILIYTASLHDAEKKCTQVAVSLW